MPDPTAFFLSCSSSARPSLVASLQPPPPMASLLFKYHHYFLGGGSVLSSEQGCRRQSSDRASCRQCCKAARLLLQSSTILKRNMDFGQFLLHLHQNYPWSPIHLPLSAAFPDAAWVCHVCNLPHFTHLNSPLLNMLIMLFF